MTEGYCVQYQMYYNWSYYATAIGLVYLFVCLALNLSVLDNLSSLLHEQVHSLLRACRWVAVCWVVQGADMDHPVSTANSVPSESLAVTRTVDAVTRTVDDSQVKLLCAQLSLQTQQTQLLHAQVQLLRSQLSAETAARLHCQVQQRIFSQSSVSTCIMYSSHT